MIRYCNSKTFITASAVLCFTAGVFAPSVPAYAQASDTAAAAAAEIRFQQLEKEIRRLTGQVEEQNFEIRQLKDELAKIKGEMDGRLRDMERNTDEIDYTASSSSQSDVVGTSVMASSNTEGDNQVQTLGTINRSADTGEVTSSGSDSAPKAYDFAYSFIKSRDFDRAEVEFDKFIKTYPNHDLVANAKYWYGETFYVRGDYNKSARIFAEGYQNYPKSSKAASNLLKLGMSLVGMNKSDDACIAFKQLKKEYSKSSVPVLKRADSEMEKINCR